MVDRARVLADIVGTADALTEPHQHLEPIHDYDVHRNRRLRRVHVTIQPGLLQQLADAIPPGVTIVEGSSSGGYRSAPPLCLEALSHHAQIQIAVVRWCWNLRIEQRDTTASSIRALVGATGNLEPDTASQLLTELRQWRTWCAVLTGWQTAAYAPRVPCPACERASALRINLTRKTAMCIHCDASWDETTIGVLADYIRTATEAA